MSLNKNIAASIQARLKNEAKLSNVAFATLLEQFALSRFFARLSKSPYADQFILKGAQLFRIWSGQNHRPTRDADFLSFGNHDPDALAAIFNSICAETPVQDDALEWLSASAAAIRKENAYGGTRIKIIALLGNMRIPLQMDVGFGDVISPAKQIQTWPGILNFSSIQLTTYPVETVIAEKLEALVSLGMTNSRMKDFYDLYWLVKNQEIDRKDLAQAIRNTFARRKTPLPKSPPVAFTSEFFDDAQKNTQWKAFLRKSKLTAPALPEVIQSISPLLMTDSI